MDEHRPRLLLLAGKYTNQPEVTQALAGMYQVDVYEDVDLAIQKLRQEEYYAIFADVGDFLPLERTLVDRQASLVLNTIGEGVSVVDEFGQVLWLNQRMRRFPEQVQDRIRQTCMSAHSVFTYQVASTGTDKPARQLSKKYGFQVNEDQYFEAIVSPVVESDRVKQVVAVVWDATSGRRLQQKIDAIDAAGRELVRLEADNIQKLNVGQRLKLLEDKIIRYTSDLMHFDHFCIRLLNKRTNKLELVIAVGLPPEAMEVDLYAQPEGNGISGYVASTGRSYICHDVEKDNRYVLGLDHARSSLTVPLRLHDKVIGVFNVESQAPGAFNEDDRQFAEIFGRYVAMALHILDLLVVERFTTSGRMVDNVVQEIAAPINDILAEAKVLIDEHGYDEKLRARLEAIMTSAEDISKSARHAADAPRTVLGARNVQTRKEPELVGKCIMIADDEPNIRNTIGDVLKKCGCQVFIACDGHEAIGIIDQQPLDLILSDIRMPHRTGYEIYSAAKRKKTDLPVILMTGFGYDPHHSIVRASQEGLAAVLFKPFKVDQLLVEVRKALNIAQPTESNT